MTVLTTPHSLSFPAANHILSALPKDEYKRLLPELVPVRFPRGKVLWEVGDAIRHAFFLLSGMTSLLSITQSGSTIEIAMIGNEGLAGVSAMLGFAIAPYKVVAQLPATALRIRVEALNREFKRGGPLQDLLLRFAHTLLTQVSQSAACSRFHTTEQRLCRWLLISRDRAGANTIPLTHEFLAQMIGCPRTSVSTIAAQIQRQGLIQLGRGRVQILDARGLEAYSCECYKVITQGINRFLAA